MIRAPKTLLREAYVSKIFYTNNFSGHYLFGCYPPEVHFEGETPYY